jgi:hypothetical protein
VAIIGIWPFYTYLTWKNLSLYAGNLHHVSLPECNIDTDTDTDADIDIDIYPPCLDALFV